MFINYYFPLRAPGGGSSQRSTVSLLCIAIFQNTASLFTITIFTISAIIRGGKNTYKKYTYFYFLWDNFYFTYPIYLCMRI